MAMVHCPYLELTISSVQARVCDRTNTCKVRSKEKAEIGNVSTVLNWNWSSPRRRRVLTNLTKVGVGSCGIRGDNVCVSLASKFGGFSSPSRARETERKTVEPRAAANESAVHEKHDYKLYQELMQGGEEVVETMKEMTELLEDIAGMDSQEEEAAVQMAAAGAVGQRLDKLEGNYLMALDYMLQQAVKDNDDKRKWLLQVIKDTVLAQLEQKANPEVQVIGALCKTWSKDARQEILSRCAAGGGSFETEKGGKVQLPAANLNLVANQADDIIMTMEEKQCIQDRRLLARLILVREETRSLMGGGILDARNDNKGFTNLPEPEVNFITKITAIRPGPTLRKRLESVMRGKDEGADPSTDDTENRSTTSPRRIHFESKIKDSKKHFPVRPGLFLETVTKVLGGMYTSNAARGVTVQQLEWVTLLINGCAASSKIYFLL